MHDLKWVKAGVNAWSFIIRITGVRGKGVFKYKCEAKPPLCISSAIFIHQRYRDAFVIYCHLYKVQKQKL